MGKRTFRTIHYELVARVIEKRIIDLVASGGARIPIVSALLTSIANDFADEFEIRAGVHFDRAKFLKSCGIGD